MDILKQLLRILILCLCGEMLSSLLPFAFPASVISLLLLFLFLLLHLIKTEQIVRVAEFFLHSMAFFFVPSGVAIMDKYKFIQGALLPLLMITVFTTIVTFVATGYTVLLFIKFMNKKESKNP